MAQSSNITLDSEVVLAEAGTLQEYENNIIMYVVKDLYYNADKVGFFISQKQEEPMQHTKPVEPVVVEQEEPVTNCNWLNKYMK